MRVVQNWVVSGRCDVSYDGVLDGYQGVANDFTS